MAKMPLFQGCKACISTAVYCAGHQIVPTIYQDIRNRTIATNQYSVTEHFKQSDVPTGHQLPGVFFFYDLSPIKVPTRPHNILPFRF